MAGLGDLYRVLKPGSAAVLVISHPCFPLPDAITDDAKPTATFVLQVSYFEVRSVTGPPWGHFSSDFFWYHRPPSRYWQAFRQAGALRSSRRVETPAVNQLALGTWQSEPRNQVFLIRP